MRYLFPLAALAGFSLLPAADPAPAKPAITWKKTVLDPAFRSEGVAVADVNKDGKMDILNGECWYEAPDWKRHEIRPSKDHTRGKANVYSTSFACWADDLDGDGYPDLIVIGFPGAPCHWYENPKGKTGHWKRHEIWHSACNETPQYVDLFGTGKRVLVMGYQQKGREGAGQMAWFAPGKDPAKTWEMHPISDLGAPATLKVTEKIVATFDDAGKVEKLKALVGKTFPNRAALAKAVGPSFDKKVIDQLAKAATVPGRHIPGTNRFDHGLGIGDVNGDGRADVITTGGWWEQPARADGKTPWKFHAGRTSDSCADIYAFDIDGDGKPDLLSSSAHGIGIWWHKQTARGGNNAFQTRPLFAKLVSQTHALVMADIDGDGQKDFVTGKRWWAHGPSGDVDPSAPAKLFWFEAKKAKDGLIGFTPHEIDGDSGIGTQFAVADVNGDGLPDVATSNKKGTFLFLQQRAKK